MKAFRLLLLFVLSAFVTDTTYAQVQPSYEQQWKKVDDLVKKSGQPKTALEEVRKIYARAKREGQEAQLIKALIYQATLQSQTREDNETASIKELEQEITTARDPAASILKSILASQYQQYLERHRWQLYQRTNTKAFDKKDVATWTLEDLHQKISRLYLESISNKDLLTKTRLETYDPIITKGNVRQLRPTLYDLLAHAALPYFQSDERDLRRPAYAFEIRDAEAFAPAPAFVRFRFETKDSLSLQQRALTIYQELIALHLSDAKPDALIDVDIDRIQFVHQRSVHPGKDSLYLQALHAIAQKYPGNPFTHQAIYLRAQYYFQSADRYESTRDTAFRMYRVLSRNILREVLKDSSVKSEGWTNSFNLMNEINRAFHSFEIEKVNIPGEPFRALISYKNLTQLHLRIIRADENWKKQLQEGLDDKAWASLVSSSALRTWTQVLPADEDYQRHATEIKIDALPAGGYILVASPVEKPRLGKHTVSAQFFHVSDISYIHHANEFFVLHRNSGQPLAGAAVEVYRNVYGPSIRGYQKKTFDTITADGNGYLKVDMTQEESKRNPGYFVSIRYKGDQLDLNDQIYQYHNYDDYANKPTNPEKIYFFTDRSIYRPGQILHFKGLSVNTKGTSNTAFDGFTSTVYLLNANGEKTDSLAVTANAFGSFSGKFNLPQGIFNGLFMLQEARTKGYTQFRVEEYKRPKFYVTLEKPKTTYKVNDSITISGSAVAYTGSHIQQAVVRYRVLRQPRFPYPWITWRSIWPQSQPMEIAHGEIRTNDSGRFSFSFNALPDLTIDQKLDPVFDYRIHTDITDIGGETRSAEGMVSAGYKSIILKTVISERLPVDSFRSIKVRAENMNGEPISATITVSIKKLLPEQRLVRQRLWKQPDQFVYSKEEFLSHFPHDEYRKESDFKTWEKGPVVFTGSDSSRRDSTFMLNGNVLQPGFYELELSTVGPDGQLVKNIQYLELYDPKSNRLSRPVYLWTKGVDRSFEPGETAHVQIGTAAENVFLVRETNRTRDEMNVSTPGDKDNVFSFDRLNNEKKEFTTPIEERDRGGYGLNFFFVKHNRLHQFNEVVPVPWTNKELQVEYSTFRDKLVPGAAETWTIRLRGHKGERVAAEMLASMYDASLDQFNPHQWNKPSVWPQFRQSMPWSGQANFITVQPFSWYGPDQGYRSYEKRYDQLISVWGNGINGLNVGYGVRPESIRIRGMATDAVSAAPPAIQGNRYQKQSVRDLMQSSEEADGLATDTVVAQQLMDQPTLQVRTNLSETAFFFPHLQTDSTGALSFSFKTPETLTRWKFQSLSHTKEMAFGLSQKEIVTKKDLMVQPNAPRFLRQGDRLEFPVRVVNLSDRELTGQAELQLTDASTSTSVDGWFMNTFPNQYFTVPAGGTVVVHFPIEIPHQFTSVLSWRVIARAGNFSDGEEMSIPVLSNRMLVTETFPLPVRGDSVKHFRFHKLLGADSSATLQHHALTVEYTSNPAWYVVQAIPYLAQNKLESSDNVWQRYYANALATHIVQKAPRIRGIMEKWKTSDTAALLSNLQKNEELKSVLLAETPWVLEAKTEMEQKHNIALLFDLVRMNAELGSHLQQLKAMQTGSGGFSWVPEGPDDRFITQYIVSGIGHLKKLGALPADHQKEIAAIVNKALPYLDQKMKEDHDRLLRLKADQKKQVPGQLQVQYLYMRSFFTDRPVKGNAQKAYTYYREQLKQSWLQTSKYMQGMAALALHRTGDSKTATVILRSLKETSITHEELGTYWKDNTFGRSPFWWHAPLETQSMLIEAFQELSRDTLFIDGLRTWLIRHKQTNNWNTTKATAEACYALLLRGSEWLNTEPMVQVRLGSQVVSNVSGAEAGTGYFRETIPGAVVKPAMGEIAVAIQTDSGQKTTGPTWGAVYWQYFEDMDKVTSGETSLKLQRKLFVETNTDRGPVLTPLPEGSELKPGDKVRVRIELRVDRDMEYVHMRDMRASSMEPVNVLSHYKWQDGLGYYETTKDTGTEFFFSFLRKGTYVFEYPLFVSHKGSFSAGVTSIQCLYAPEFSAHSEGIRVNVASATD